MTTVAPNKCKFNPLKMPSKASPAPSPTRNQTPLDEQAMLRTECLKVIRKKDIIDAIQWTGSNVDAIKKFLEKTYDDIDKVVLFINQAKSSSVNTKSKYKLYYVAFNSKQEIKINDILIQSGRILLLRSPEIFKKEYRKL